MGGRNLILWVVSVVGLMLAGLVVFLFYGLSQREQEPNEDYMLEIQFDPYCPWLGVTV